MQGVYKTNSNKDIVYAWLFLGLVVIFIATMFVTAISSTPQIILGSELNGDGSVEYLCLGTDCENLTRLDW